MHISTRNKINYFGLSRYCPICKSWLRYFKPAGEKGRKDAVCPVCGSFERHRLVWLFFKKKTRIFTAPLKMLHIAPENCFVRRLRAQRNLEYISIDMESKLADKKMDVTALQFPDSIFDICYCSHVLEHIPDDQKAIAEMFRVLKPGGMAIILVPIGASYTIEDPSITDPVERQNQFGQPDHVRIYGPDIINRLAKKFTVNPIEYYLQFNPFIRRFYSLSREQIFLCHK